MAKTALLSFVLLIGLSVSLRAGITMEKFGFGGSVYWIVYDTDSKPSDNLVVFLHGYGASNPGCYEDGLNIL